MDFNTFTGMFYSALAGLVGLVMVLVTSTVKVNTLMVRQSILLEELIKTVRRYEDKNDAEHREIFKELELQHDKIKSSENFCKYAHADKPRIQ